MQIFSFCAKSLPFVSCFGIPQTTRVMFEGLSEPPKIRQYSSMPMLSRGFTALADEVHDSKLHITILWRYATRRTMCGF